MSNITTYSIHDNTIRTLASEQNETMFCLADVCKVLTLQNPAHAVAQIKEEFSIPTLNVGMVTRPDGSSIEATFITEPQLYFVMMRSRAKVAREFRQWICNEVLPSIRKNGMYVKRKPEIVSYTDKDGKKVNMTEEDFENFIQQAWYARKIHDQLKGKIGLVDMFKTIQVAGCAWRQGYAVACDKFEREQREREEKEQKEQKALIHKQDTSLATYSQKELVEIAHQYAELGTKALKLLASA